VYSIYTVNIVAALKGKPGQCLLHIVKIGALAIVFEQLSNVIDSAGGLRCAYHIADILPFR